MVSLPLATPSTTTITEEAGMQFGLGLPSAGEAASGPNLIRFAQRADELGFESLWCGDHILLPTAGTNQYPYTADGSFPRDASVGFLETLTVLSYVASVTQRIRLGSTVIILPYRNPVVQAKMFASLDVLSGGRVICGVGVGWLEKEFDSLGVPYADRGPGASGTVAFRSGNALVGTTQDIIDDAKRCQDIGIHQLTYDFRTDDINDQIAIMERLVERVIPAVNA